MDVVHDAAPTESTDATLIVDSLKNPRAFMTVVQRHQRVLYGYLARRVGPDLAEDIAAETFTRAYAQRKRFDPAWSDARPWLFGIASNLLRTHARSESRRLRAYARAAQPDHATAEDDRAVARADAELTAPRLAAAIESLSEGDRDALLMFAWADMGYDEIAAALDIPTGTVRSRLNRARRLVQASLAEPERNPS